MARRWMREINLTGAAVNNGHPFIMKMTQYFLQYCCGYTFVSENASTGSFNTHEKTGLGGIFSGSSKTFTDLGSPFVAGDVGKWLLVVDPGNDENNGWYKIITFTDVNNVVIDFRSGATEYPTAAGALTWYIMAEDYQTPPNTGDYFRLTTPHADAWEIEFYNDVSFARIISISVSLSATWGGGVVDILGSGNCLLGHIAPENSPAQHYWYVEADTNGDMFNMWFHHTAGGGALVSLGTLSFFEAGHTNKEQWVLLGNAEGNPNTSTSRFDRIVHHADAGYWNNCRWFDEKFGKKREGHLVEFAIDDWSMAFTTWGFNEQNARIAKNDMMAGSVLLMDWDNNDDAYQFLGRVLGHYSVRNNLPQRQVLNESGTNDKYHIASGIAVEWPGFTPQF